MPTNPPAYPTTKTYNALTIATMVDQWNIPGTDITIYTIQDTDGVTHKTMSPNLGLRVGVTFTNVEEYTNNKNRTYLRLAPREEVTEATTGKPAKDVILTSEQTDQLDGQTTINLDDIPF